MINSVLVPHFLIYNTNVCSDTCPDGQYSNATSNKCLLCDMNCKTCEVNSTNCLSCGFSSLGYVVYLNANICVQQCPDGFYEDTSSKQCKPCNDGCTLCSGPLLTECSACKNISLTVYYKYYGFNICDTLCPLGQYINLTVPNKCSPCSPQCVACEGISTNCTAA